MIILPAITITMQDLILILILLLIVAAVLYIIRR